MIKKFETSGGEVETHLKYSRGLEFGEGQNSFVRSVGV